MKDVPTPALLLDLDIMERNLSRMSDFFRDKPAKLRPHFKAHQVVTLAERQIQAGAVGITCARVEHAELLVNHGIEDILIANEIAGDHKIAHFVELSHRAPVIIAVDNDSVVAAMAAMAGDHVHELNVVIDLDVRLGRCGVQPGAPALTLTKAILAKGLRFRGVEGVRGAYSSSGRAGKAAYRLSISPASRGYQISAGTRGNTRRDRNLWRHQ